MHVCCIHALCSIRASVCLFIFEYMYVCGCTCVPVSARRGPKLKFFNPSLLYMRRGLPSLLLELANFSYSN